MWFKGIKSFLRETLNKNVGKFSYILKLMLLLK